MGRPIDSTTYLANRPLSNSLDSLSSEWAASSEWFRTQPIIWDNLRTLSAHLGLFVHQERPTNPCICAGTKMSLGLFYQFILQTSPNFFFLIGKSCCYRLPEDCKLLLLTLDIASGRSPLGASGVNSSIELTVVHELSPDSVNTGWWVHQFRMLPEPSSVKFEAHQISRTWCIVITHSPSIGYWPTG